MADMKTDKVRQGRSGKPVLYVLLIALALCLVVFAGLGIYGSVLPDQNIGGTGNSGVSTETETPAGTDGATVTPNEANSSASTPDAAPNAPAN